MSLLVHARGAEALGMTNSAWEAGGRRLLTFLASRLPFLITFGCLLLLNWGVALWLIHAAHQDREIAAYQMLNDEVKFVGQQAINLFSDADRALRDLRERDAGSGLSLDLDRWATARNSGGIAWIS